jgi:hypothetical protein
VNSGAIDKTPNKLCAIKLRGRKSLVHLKGNNMRGLATTIALASVICWPCSAAVVSKYRYDALGRIVIADQSVTSAPAAGHASVYTYDNADNRSAADISVVVRKIWLPAEARLYQGQSIISEDGRFRLTFERNGNAALYDQFGRRRWQSGTAGQNGNYLRMQTDGNLVIYTASTVPVWSTNTAGNQGAQLAVQIDGNLVLYRSGVAIWAIGGCGACNN